MSILTDMIDAFDRFWDEHGDKIIPIFGVIALILFCLLVGYFMVAILEIFMECVPSNETIIGTVCRFRVK